MHALVQMRACFPLAAEERRLGMAIGKMPWTSARLAACHPTAGHNGWNG